MKLIQVTNQLIDKKSNLTANKISHHNQP